MANIVQARELSLESESIAVIIPMYRVEAQIANVIQSIPTWVRHIVLVNDASPDNTSAEVAKIKDGRITLITHENNRGVGGAMISGFVKAIELGATVVVKMDGDGQMSPENIVPLIEPILSGTADFAKGNRFELREGIGRMPLARRWGNIGLSFITKAASGYWNVFDPTNGFFAIDAKMLSRIRLSNLHPRYFFESSLLCELNRCRAVVTDIPMPSIYGDAPSSLSTLRSLLEFPPLLSIALLKRIARQYFLFDFSLGSLYLVVGILLNLFGGLWGLFWWMRSIQTNIAATTGTVMIAVLPIVVGIQLLIQFTAFDVQSVPRTAANERGRLKISIAQTSPGETT